MNSVMIEAEKTVQNFMADSLLKGSVKGVCFSGVDRTHSSGTLRTSINDRVTRHAEIKGAFSRKSLPVLNVIAGFLKGLFLQLHPFNGHRLSRLSGGAAGQKQGNQGVSHGSSHKRRTILVQPWGMYKCR